MRHSLHARIVAAAGAAIVLAVAVLGALVLARVHDQLRTSLDGELRTRAAEVARLHATTPQILTTPGALEGRLGGATLHVQVIDRRGRIVARSSGLGGRVLPISPAAVEALRERRIAFGDAWLGELAIRVLAAPLGPLGRGPAAGGAVLVAAETQGADDTIGAAGDAVLIAGGAAALLAMLLAALLVRVAMRPLRVLSSGAEDIARTQDATRRLAVPRSKDEIHSLAETLNDMLAALQRARAVEQRFVADASHELRTPLTALRGNAAYLERHGADPEALADLRDSADRLSGLMDDLLVLAREDAAGTVSRTPVDLAAVAQEVLESHPGPARLDVPDRTRVEAEGDRAALLLAVGNLVGNARKHGPPGALVTVRVRREHRQAVVDVHDEGPGLSQAGAMHAFDRFWRDDPGRPGSGLGLAIVRAVAERHGGTVRVQGSTFSVRLPLSEGSPDPPLEPDRPHRSPQEIP